MFRKVMLLVIAMLMLSSASYAAIEQTGLMEKTEVQGAFAYLDVADISATLLALRAGKFVTPNLEVTLGFMWGSIEDLDILGVAPEVAYHFISENTTNIVPYVGVGWWYFDISNGGSFDDNGFDFFAGAKFFMDGDYNTSNHAVFAEYRYMNDVVDENVSVLMVGITNFF